MTDYDSFAPFYDAVMGSRRDVIRIIERQIAKHHPTASTVLELGCGTGSILKGLAGKFQVTGIERSPEMLRIARAKLPEASLHQGTIAGFKLGRRFDVIICVFDTINHLTTLSDWQKLFTATRSHLTPGGIFIFDMNTIGRQQLLTRVPGYEQTFGRRNTMQMTVTSASHGVVEWHVSVEVPQRDHTIQVYEEFVKEAAFPLEVVRSELTGTGFSILDAFDSDRAEPTDDSDRVYFVCRAQD